MTYAALDRPALKEVVGIVLACAVVLVLLVRLDRAAYEAEMDRVRKAIAAQRAEPAPAAIVALRRITGPAVAVDAAADAARPADRPPLEPRATVTAAPPEATASRPTDTIVLVLAGVGTLLMAVGGVLTGLGRR